MVEESVRRRPSSEKHQDREGAKYELYPKTPMAAWYDLHQLASTALDVAVSALVGRRTDYRKIEALGGPAEYYDYSFEGAPAITERLPDGSARVKRAPTTNTAREEMWLDYVADVGDGWNSSFAVASLMGRAALPPKARVGRDPGELPRADVVVMGGDEVYPSATSRAYKERLVRPLHAALPDPPVVRPELFAIPGNHDWYDGLVAFTRLFCQGRTVAAWQTRQSRSYFALRLPANVWLLGLDFQLDTDIDREQVEYFEWIVGEMDPGSSIILCVAEPVWVESALFGDPKLRQHLAWFEKKILAARRQHVAARVQATSLPEPDVRVVVRIAGDLHHYRRHTGTDDGREVHAITAGGGGAFLHPTHNRPKEKDRKDESPRNDGVRAGPMDAEIEHEEKESFPTADDSRSLTSRNLGWGFLRRNPSFAAVCAAVYGFLALGAVHLSPLSMLAGLFVILLFCVFTDVHAKPTTRAVLGIVHGTLHVFAAVFGAVKLDALLVAHPLPDLLGLCGLSTPSRFEAGACGLGTELALMVLVGMVGAIVGPVLMGVYLWFSLNVLGIHGNEAFSSLRIEDWKSFLRIQVTGDALVVRAIGIKEVPKRWLFSKEAPGPLFVPDERTSDGQAKDIEWRVVDEIRVPLEPRATSAVVSGARAPIDNAPPPHAVRVDEPRP